MFGYNGSLWLSRTSRSIWEMKHATFFSHGRQPEVSFFSLFTFVHTTIIVWVKKRDDYFGNLEETTVLACEMFTSGFRPWLKNSRFEKRSPRRNLTELNRLINNSRLKFRVASRCCVLVFVANAERHRDNQAYFN